MWISSTPAARRAISPWTAADPMPTIRRVADLCDLDADRVRLWLFARAAAEPRDDWSSAPLGLARALRQ